MSFLLAVARNATNLSGAPIIYTDKASLRFLREELHLTEHAFCTKFEAVAVLEGPDPALGNGNKQRVDLKTSIRAMADEGLRESPFHLINDFYSPMQRTDAITNDSKAKMSWTAYEENVVERHSVALVGFPFETVKDLGVISVGALTLIKNAFEANVCYWVKLSASELAARKQARLSTQLMVEQRVASPQETSMIDHGVPNSNSTPPPLPTLAVHPPVPRDAPTLEAILASSTAGGTQPVVGGEKKKRKQRSDAGVPRGPRRNKENVPAVQNKRRKTSTADMVVDEQHASSSRIKSAAVVHSDSE